MFKKTVLKIFGGLASAARAVLTHRRKILAAIFASLAVFCGIYWLLCGIFAGFGIAQLWLWLIFGSAFVVLWLWFGDKRPFRRLTKIKWLRRAVAIFLCICALYFVIIEGLVISGMTTDEPEGLDYIIVLGAKVNGTNPSLALRCRIDCAYEYLAENPNTIAILSGGQGRGEDISEAEAMRRELVKRGIAEERLILEDRSTSTEENLDFSYPLIPDAGASVGLVTNNFHIFRALTIARNRHGHKADCVVGVAARYPNVLIIHYMIREFLSITFYALMGKM